MEKQNSSDKVQLIPNNIISLGEASKLSGLSADHLRRLVEHGAFWGLKIGRNWVTTKQAIEEYMSTNRSRGRKPKPIE